MKYEILYEFGEQAAGFRRDNTPEFRIKCDSPFNNISYRNFTGFQK
ncbi:MAG: hypothetical protein ACE5D7_00715 [Fidelibacterota bacterium]